MPPTTEHELVDDGARRVAAASHGPRIGGVVRSVARHQELILAAILAVGIALMVVHWT
jgi:hypothetical protein